MIQMYANCISTVPFSNNYPYCTFKKLSMIILFYLWYGTIPLQSICNDLNIYDILNDNIF